MKNIGNSSFIKFKNWSKKENLGVRRQDGEFLKRRIEEEKEAANGSEWNQKRGVMRSARMKNRWFESKTDRFHQKRACFKKNSMKMKNDCWKQISFDQKPVWKKRTCFELRVKSRKIKEPKKGKFLIKISNHLFSVNKDQTIIRIIIKLAYVPQGT
jgi:hypothetical protein